MTNDELLKAAQKNLKALGEALGKQVATNLKADNVTNTTDLYLQLSDVKESFTRIYGKLKDIPDEVYTQIAKTLLQEIDSIVFVKYSKDELLDQLATQISKVFTKIDDKELTVDGTTYEISFKGSRLGMKGKFIRVSDGSKESWLNWKSESYGQSVMARYLLSTFKVDTYYNEATFPKVLTLLNSNGFDLFSAILDGSDSLKKVLGNKVFKAFGTDIQYKLESLMLSVSNDKVHDALMNYVSLNNAYKDLTAAQSVDDVKNLSASFTSLAETLNTSLSDLGASVKLETLTPTIDLAYNKTYTAVTVPAGYTTELETTDYKSSVKKIYAGKLKESIIIHGNSKNNIITGGTKADTLYGGSGKDKLYGGKGDDVLIGGKGNDTLTGGKGSDIFVYAKGDGKDVITDYTLGDKIKLTSGTISKVTKSGSNVTFKVGSGSIKVQNTKDKEITFIMPNESECVYRNGYWFTDDTTSRGDLDKLMNVLPTSSADPISMDDDSPNKLLSAVTFANTTTKNFQAG